MPHRAKVRHATHNLHALTARNCFTYRQKDEKLYVRVVQSLLREGHFGLSNIFASGNITFVKRRLNKQLIKHCL